MKKIAISFLMILSVVSYSQTPITNANIQTAVNSWVSDSSAATTTY